MQQQIEQTVNEIFELYQKYGETGLPKICPV